MSHSRTRTPALSNRNAETSGPQQRRRRLRPEARRLELIEAGERVLREKGLDARVEDVVREARTAKGTFYLYFDSWEELLLQIRTRIFVDFSQKRLECARRDQQSDWRGYIEVLSAAFVNYTLELEGLHEAIFHGPIAAAPYPETEFGACGIIADSLRAGAESGAFDIENPEFTGRLVFAVLRETVDAISSGADREKTMAAMRNFLRRALLKEA